MPRYTVAQLAAAVRAGPPPRVDNFDDEAVWHTYQAQWFESYLPDQLLPPPCEPARRNAWKSATRRHHKMVQQIEKDVSHSQSGREYLTAWAQRSSQSFTQMSVYSDDGLSQSFVWGSASESLLRRLGALDPEYLPRCTKMRKADALSHPPPNI